MHSTPTHRDPLKSRFSRFFNASGGGMSVMTAIAAVPVLIAAGAAIDLVRFNSAQAKVQAALDAASLSAAALKDASDSLRIAAGEKMFLANTTYSNIEDVSTKANFRIVEGKVVGTAHLDMGVNFMQLAGIEKLTAESIAEVNILNDKKAEIVLVLDYSGSMGETVGGGVKYVAMKEAAKKLVQDLSAAEPDKVKFGLVPFSHHVYTTLPGAHVLGGGSGSWTGCTQDRQYPHNLADSTPTSANKSKWNQPWAPVHAGWGCAAYVDNNLKTMDLGRDFTGIQTKLDAMRPYAWTHIALGVEFGYHMLSPNAPFTSGADYSDKGTKKYMVVLTDGMQTAPGFGPGGVRSVAQGEDNLAQLCESAKANGITIMTMAFDLDDSTTRERLQDCATDKDKDFFVADDGAALAEAFNSVKEAITAQTYLSK